MEQSIPFGAYTGLPTPFGGPSLEWELENNPLILSKEEEKDARMTAHGVPEIITSFIIPELRRTVFRGFPKSSSNVERQVTSFSLPIIERIKDSDNAKYVTEIRRDLYSGSDEAQWKLAMRATRAHYLFTSLGVPRTKPHSVRLVNWEVHSRIKIIAEDLGLWEGDVAALCLVAGLAQSLDGEVVPSYFRDRCIEEVNRFEWWVKRGKRV